MPQSRKGGRSYRPEEVLGPLGEVERKHAPDALYLSGHVELLQQGVRVAVVGTRRPSPAGVRRTERITDALVRHGVTVVSGLALGIDTTAHRTAIRQGGKTIAVLGTPLDEYATQQNADLQKEIEHSHLLVSQFAPGTPVERRNFPMRNRTMALISDASVIVEAGEGSGSLSQAWEALRLGRFLFILKPILGDRSLNWPKQMLDYGALVVSTPEQLLENLPLSFASGSAELAF